MFLCARFLCSLVGATGYRGGTFRNDVNGIIALVRDSQTLGTEQGCRTKIKKKKFLLPRRSSSHTIKWIVNKNNFVFRYFEANWGPSICIITKTWSARYKNLV